MGGGMKATGDALEKGMVLALSLWDDHDVNMLWLDSNYPLDQSASTPGVARGTCATTSGVPADVESQHGDTYVRYFNIKYGELNSTVGPAPAPGPSPPSPSGCPGGSLSNCMNLCPTDPTAFQTCVKTCEAVAPKSLFEDKYIHDQPSRHE